MKNVTDASQTTSHPQPKRRFPIATVVVYAVLITWTIVALFPIFWTFSTTFKTAVDVTQGHILPFDDFQPDWKGLRSLGLSPDTIGRPSTVRDEFLLRLTNSITVSLMAAGMATILGSLAGYGLARFDYRFGWMRNNDISFFFLSQLILPPVVLAMPFLVLYKHLDLLDTKFGLVVVYVLAVLPIVIWIMRDQFKSIPVELEQSAYVDGCSIWGAFLRITLPIAGPGIVAAFLIAFILCWNEYFFAALLTSTAAKTLPVMVASQTGSQGISWWSMAAIASAAILPLVIAGIALEKYIVKGLTAGAVK